MKPLIASSVLLALMIATGAEIENIAEEIYSIRGVRSSNRKARSFGPYNKD
jgi:hypothetical protein